MNLCGDVLTMIDYRRVDPLPMPNLQAMGAGAGPFHHEALVPVWDGRLASRRALVAGKKDDLTPAK